MVWKTTLVLAALLTQAASASQVVSLYPRPISEPEKQSVREAVAKKLKDPESARFRWNPDLLDGEIYCGFVNAKNSYGGYTGYAPFMALTGTNRDGVLIAAFAAIDPGPNRVGQSAEFQMCAKNGYNLRQDAPSVTE